MRTGEKMEDKSYIERLMEFGLTRQEAGIYGCLISLSLIHILKQPAEMTGKSLLVKQSVKNCKGLNMNRDQIKFLAIITMTCNHIANIFLTPGTLLFEVMIDIGYFTAITMCYFLVEGYGYTPVSYTHLGLCTEERYYN